jgi:hypothetical protein
VCYHLREGWRRPTQISEVTRLAIVECSEPQIAAITGHSLRDVRSILDAHYLHRDPTLAESAIRKLERGRRD